MIALYARVSTKDQGQELETQLQPLRDWVAAQGRDDFNVYTDQASGTDLDRPGWRRLSKTWRTGIIDTVAVLRLDRAFRSVTDIHNVLAELDGRGIRFAVITQPIDTGTAIGKLLITVLGGVAEFEADLISERVKEGLARAKRQGKKLGRPRTDLDLEDVITALMSYGNKEEAAESLGVSVPTLNRRIRENPAILDSIKNLPDISFLKP